MSAAFTWTDAEVRQALGLGAERNTTVADFSGVTTDSRQVRPDNLYVALIGDRFDGHDFVDAAVAGGATGAVVSRSASRPEGVAFYRVDDTLVALGLLAAHRRAALSVPVVGITGSNGKTSTKDFTRGALESSFAVHATTGNLNNRIGLPMTLLTTPTDAQVVVVEMGSNEPGEIRDPDRHRASHAWHSHHGLREPLGETGFCGGRARRKARSGARPPFRGHRSRGGRTARAAFPREGATSSNACGWVV